MYARILIVAIACLTVAGALVSPAEAQFTTGAGLPQSSLVLEPRYPEPGDTVTVRLNDFSLNTTGAGYTWFINGQIFEAVNNLRAITLVAPPLGESVAIRAVTTLGGGATVVANANLVSTRVDVLIEADTLVPSFYKGRTLPSSGSTIRATALPFLTNGATDPAAYAYTWKLNGKVIDGGSRASVNSVTFSVGFGRTVELTVDVADRNGTLLVSKTTFVPISDPELYFYTVDPLQGLLEQAMLKDSIFTGEEILVRAEPYYVSRDLLSGNVLTEWKLNNRRITNPSSDPQEITLRRQGQQGSFAIGFHIRNLSQLLQGVESSVTLRF